MTAVTFEGGENTYRKKMRPLFPTLATMNLRPSRLADAPSGAILPFSALPSLDAALEAAPALCRSEAGTSGFTVAIGDSFVFAVGALNVSFVVGRGGERFRFVSRAAAFVARWLLTDIFLLGARPRLTVNRVIAGGCAASGSASMVGEAGIHVPATRVSDASRSD